MLLNQMDLHSPSWALPHPLPSHSLVAIPVVPGGQEADMTDPVIDVRHNTFLAASCRQWLSVSEGM